MERSNIGKQYILIVFLVAVVMFSSSCAQAQTIYRPSVTLPNGWSLADETLYPNASGYRDSAGAGMLLYLSSLNDIDEVRIYYEKAPDVNFTDAELRAEAEALYIQHTHGDSMNFSGVEPAAGVQSGFAKYSSVALNFTLVVRVFVKDNYYFRVIEYYKVNYQSIQQVNAIVNSISVNTSWVSTPTPSQPPSTTTPEGGSLGGEIALLLAAGAVLAVFVSLLAIRKRKKGAQKRKKR